MVAVNRLKSEIVLKGTTGEKVARRMGITPKAFYHKLKIAKFNTDDVKKLMDILDITDPVPIFFADDAT